MARRTLRISASRAFRVAGQAPTVRWSLNKSGKKRTIRQAVALAEKWDVLIPIDVIFFEAEPGELEGTWDDLMTSRGLETARGPAVYERSDGYIHWSDHYNIRGQIPFLVHPEVLRSDEAIVAVFQHELFELSALREVFFASNERHMNARDYGLQVQPGRPGNFHEQAWDAADAAVLRMRKARRR